MSLKLPSQSGLGSSRECLAPDSRPSECGQQGLFWEECSETRAAQVVWSSKQCAHMGPVSRVGARGDWLTGLAGVVCED